MQIDYSVDPDAIKNIPATGRVLIVANHPLGGLDGLALQRLVGRRRQDVSVVVNELLCNINSLRNVFLPVDAFGGETKRAYIDRIIEALNDNRAVIIFPAGEVSRAGSKGVRDGRWMSGFIRMATKTSAPVLPINHGILAVIWHKICVYRWRQQTMGGRRYGTKIGFGLNC